MSKRLKLGLGRVDGAGDGFKPSQLETGEIGAKLQTHHPGF